MGSGFAIRHFQDDKSKGFIPKKVGPFQRDAQRMAQGAGSIA
jgi:hypothetical protein